MKLVFLLVESDLWVLDPRAVEYYFGIKATAITIIPLKQQPIAFSSSHNIFVDSYQIIFEEVLQK